MPKDELQELTDSVLPLAQKMLSEHGEFYPYGGAITNKGEIISIAVYDGDEHPPSQRILDLLRETSTAQAKNGTYRATAIAYDVRVVPPGSEEKADAICIDLDHVDGLSLMLLLPYSIKENGEVVYGHPFSQAGAGRIFKKD